MTSWSTAIRLVVRRLVLGRLWVGVACVCVLLLPWAAPSWARSAPAGATATGSLTVRIVGLPPGQSVHGVLRGPGGLERSVSTVRLTISRARLGVYRLTLRAVTISHAHGSIESGAKASPVPRTSTIRVRAGHRASLVGTYGTIINPGVKTLSGGAVSVTGPPEDPTLVVLSGHQTFAPRAIISMAPSVQLPRGLLDHVVSTSYSNGNTVTTLTPASIYEVAPDFQFDIPLQEPAATAADFSAGADCGLPAGLSPYRHIKNVSFSGGWSTADVFGVHVKDGVRIDVHFTVEAGLEVTAGAGLSCSLSLAFNASGLAGPIPVTAGIEGDLNGSAGVGGVLDTGGSVEVEAGGHSVGFPPLIALLPDVSFSNPHFTMKTKQFAEATAGIGITVKAGVGVADVASLTLNVGSSLDFAAQPGSCLWDEKFGQFSAEGEVLDWHLSTPQTPAFFTRQLGSNFCPAGGSGGGGTGSGGSGGGGSGGGSGGGGGSGSGGGGSGGGGSSPPGGGPGSGGGGGPEGALAVASAGYHTCAVLNDGHVDCWGENQEGILGIGKTEAELWGVLVPTAVPGVTTAKAIATGLSMSCVLLENDTVACWGSYPGNGGSVAVDAPTPYSSTPVAVSGLTDVKSIAESDGTVCAVLGDGGVVCWGENRIGELGNGNKEPEPAASSSPSSVVGINNAVAVGAHFQGFCALLSDGTIKCWGSNQEGLLGSGSTKMYSTTPQTVTGITNATGLSTSIDSQCALLAGGSIDCWGGGYEGDLGDGSTENSSVPVRVSDITNATEVGAECAVLVTGSVDCWGSNSDGLLGRGSTEDYSLTPGPVSGITTATDITTGGDANCSRLANGTIECWGVNNQGEGGNGTENTGLVPVPVSGIE